MAPEVGKPSSEASRSRRRKVLWPRQICERRKPSSKTGTHQGGQPRRPGPEPPEPRHAPHLVDQPRDRHADEDRRLLDRAHAAALAQPLEVGQRQRDALIGGPSAPGQHVGGDPAIDVGVGQRIRIAHAHDTRLVASHVSPSTVRSVSGRSAQLSWCALRPGAVGRHHQREHLLLPGRQGVAEAPDQLGGRGRHARVRRALFLLARRHDHVQAAVRIAGGEQRRSACRRCPARRRPAPGGRTPGRRARARARPRWAGDPARRTRPRRTGRWSACPSSPAAA